MRTYFNHSDELIEYNRRAHDIAAADYDTRHIEIFNPTEQRRIQSLLRDAVDSMNQVERDVKVLDFGAGTGNLTKHLLELGVEVTAADVSAGCIAKIKQKFGNYSTLKTSLVNGKDLTGISDDCFDLVTTYSVLHHVPDYLRIIQEFVRVTKPGGIIIIDHEVCPSYWQYEKNYIDYLGELGGRFVSDHLYELGLNPGSQGGGSATLLPRIMKLFSFNAWKTLIGNMIRPEKREISSDGDIHVFPDDHIEWGAIRSSLELRCNIQKDDDYLVCREESESPAIWSKWYNNVSDMHVIIACKR